jgi:hypothetical protein
MSTLTAQWRRSWENDSHRLNTSATSIAKQISYFVNSNDMSKPDVSGWITLTRKTFLGRDQYQCNIISPQRIGSQQWGRLLQFKARTHGSWEPLIARAFLYAIKPKVFLLYNQLGWNKYCVAHFIDILDPWVLGSRHRYICTTRLTRQSPQISIHPSQGSGHSCL